MISIRFKKKYKYSGHSDYKDINPYCLTKEINTLIYVFYRTTFSALHILFLHSY